VAWGVHEQRVCSAGPWPGTLNIWFDEETETQIGSALKWNQPQWQRGRQISGLSYFWGQSLSLKLRRFGVGVRDSLGSLKRDTRPVQSRGPVGAAGRLSTCRSPTLSSSLPFRRLQV
jgi:hypothetical protein